MTSLAIGQAALPATRSTPSRKVWTGRILSGLAITFLALDAAGKIIAPDLMIATGPELGLPRDPGFYRVLGLILAACTLLHAVPRTAVLGAVLVTGYLGGAVATHLRAGSPLLGFTLFGVYVGVVMWAGLWLRDARVRALLA